MILVCKNELKYSFSIELRAKYTHYSAWNKRSDGGASLWRHSSRNENGYMKTRQVRKEDK
jgi:hypothetical protein